MEIYELQVGVFCLVLNVLFEGMVATGAKGHRIYMGVDWMVGQFQRKGTMVDGRFLWS